LRKSFSKTVYFYQILHIIKTETLSGDLNPYTT